MKIEAPQARVLFFFDHQRVGLGVGVLAHTGNLPGDFHGNGYAGNFQGDLLVSGTVSSVVGESKIDHPLDPANKYLVYLTHFRIGGQPRPMDICLAIGAGLSRVHGCNHKRNVRFRFRPSLLSWHDDGDP